MLTDFVRVKDSGIITLRHRIRDAFRILWGDDKPVVAVKGWVETLMRERGKIVPGSRRKGHNIWTNTGREYLAMLMSLETLPTTSFRNDRIGYVGVGTGSQPEDVGVTKLIEPVAYSGSLWLAAVDTPPTFPLTPVRTTVEYRRVFTETELTPGPSDTLNISELGLFTNGSPLASPAFDPGTRDRTLTNAALQAPVAYKALEPFEKNNDLQLEVLWQIRF